MKRKQIISFHRYLAIICFPILLLMTTTGLLLNHTDQLHLNKIELNWGWLMTWYSIEKPEKIQSFSTKSIHVTKINQSIFVDESESFKTNESIIGIASTKGILYLAFQKKLYLLDNSGHTIEILEPYHDLPTPITRIGFYKNNIILQNPFSNHQLNFEEMTFMPFSAKKNIQWSKENKIYPQVSKKHIQDYSGEGVSVHKLILDLHNGFFFTHYGKYLLDFIGILFLLLSWSGVSLLIRPKKNNARTNA